MEDIIASLTQKVGKLELRICHCNGSTLSASKSSSNKDTTDSCLQSDLVIQEMREAGSSSGPMAMVSDPEIGASVPVGITKDFYGEVTDHAEAAPLMI